MSVFFDYSQDFLNATNGMDPEKDWQLASTAKLNDVLYIAHASERLAKYDGDAIYWAGVPQPDQITTATNTGTLAGTYKYIATYIQVDARGNTYESVASVESATVSPSTQSVDLTLPNNFDFAGRTDDEEYNKFKINRGYANGNQSGVTTINMTWTDPGASALTDNEKLSVGNIVYFLDRSSGNYVSRKITAVTATTITIAGAAVNVNNNDPFSANLRLAIYRTKDSGNDFYLLAELPWNIEFNGVYNDNTADSSLGAQYLYPLDGSEHVIPPIAGYSLDSSTPSADCWTSLTTYKSRLIMAGANSAPSEVVFSETNAPEYFPATNSFILGEQDSSRITGLYGTERFLIVFKKRSCYRITGSLESNDITVETLSNTVGCISQHSIQQIVYGGRSRIVFLAEDGVYEIIEGAPPLEVSFNIRYEFADRQLIVYPSEIPDFLRVSLRRATSVVDVKERKYWLYIPYEDISQIPPHVLQTTPDGQDRVLVYDYGLADRGEQPQWYKWDDINMSGGAVLFDGLPVWQYYATHYNTQLRRKTDREDKWAAFDHVSVITSFVEFGSLNGSSPDVLSKFLRVKLCSLDHKVVDSFTVSLKTLLDYEWFNNTTNYNALTMSFGSSQTNQRAVQSLRDVQAFALRYRLDHSTAGERPILTAIVTEIVIPFTERLKEDRRPHISV